MNQRMNARLNPLTHVFVEGTHIKFQDGTGRDDAMSRAGFSHTLSGREQKHIVQAGYRLAGKHFGQNKNTY